MLSFSFNCILVESWDSLILTFNTHPATHHPTEKVVNHATSLNLYHLRPSSTPTLTSTKAWVEINITIQFSNQPPNRKSSWTATLSTVSTPGFDYIFHLNWQLNLSLAQLSPSLFINFSLCIWNFFACFLSNMCNFWGAISFFSCASSERLTFVFKLLVFQIFRQNLKWYGGHRATKSRRIKQNRQTANLTS